MKNLVYWCVILLFATSVQAQKSTYLIVRFDEARNTSHDIFYKINAEAGNPFAAEVYGLVPYNSQRATEDTTVDFFAKQNPAPAANSYYNYFSTPTEALLFLSSKGWEVVSVNNEITSNGANSVSFRFIYFLKKEKK